MSRAYAFDPPHCTYDDYKSWEGRWELIGGTAHAMSPVPSVSHQAVSNRIAWPLENAPDGCAECRALLPVDWRIGDDAVVQPDNLVVCHPVEGAYIARAPELMFEVLSKSTALEDQNAKSTIDETEGVRYDVMVNVDDRVCEVFHRQEGRCVELADAVDETLSSIWAGAASPSTSA